MGLDPSILHAEHIARRLTRGQRKAAGVQTSAEAQAKAEARSERELQDAIAATLHRRGIDYIRPRMDKRSPLPPGWADFTVFISGRAIFLECKTETGQLEPNQIDFRDRMQARGFEYHLVRSYAEGMRALLL